MYLSNYFTNPTPTVTATALINATLTLPSALLWLHVRDLHSILNYTVACT